MTDKSLKPNSKDALLALEVEVQRIIAPLGYEVVAIEQSSAPKGAGRTLALYIDFAENEGDENTRKRISLDDCLVVNDALDALFETTTLVDGAYNLEVSSPGVERPLRRPKDYQRFVGWKVRIHTFRPLEAGELENAKYWERNQKQKNFVGKLEGLNDDESKIKVNVDGATVTVPMSLVTKAHLEYTPPK